MRQMPSMYAFNHPRSRSGNTGVGLNTVLPQPTRQSSVIARSAVAGLSPLSSVIPGVAGPSRGVISHLDPDRIGPTRALNNIFSLGVVFSIFPSS